MRENFILRRYLHLWVVDFLTKIIFLRDLQRYLWRHRPRHLRPHCVQGVLDYWPPNQLPESSSLGDNFRTTNILPNVFSTLLLLCCWQMWKHRKGVIFHDDTPSMRRLVGICHAESQASCYQLPPRKLDGYQIVNADRSICNTPSLL
jgi:hypothetical protein